VQQHLLQLDYIPAGMELFPASNKGLWETIKGVIDESDYYLLLVGARYGQICEDEGISWTEREFNYAIEQMVPAAALICARPQDIYAVSEEDAQHEDELTRFRERLKKGDLLTPSYWNNIRELDRGVGVAMRCLERDHPDRPGWLRGEPGEKNVQIDDEGVKEAVDDVAARGVFRIRLCLRVHGRVHECGEDDCPAEAVCVTVLRKARNEIRTSYIRGAIERLVRGRMTHDAIEGMQDRACEELGTSDADPGDLCIADKSFESILDIMEGWGLIEHGHKADTWRDTVLGARVRHSFAEQEQGR